MSLPPSLSLVPPTDEAAQGWASEPFWLVVYGEGDEPDVHTLVGLWDGLTEELEAIWADAPADEDER